TRSTSASTTSTGTGTTTRAAAAPSTGSTVTATTRTATSNSSRTTAAGTDVPAGTEVDVRLTNNLNSGSAKVEDRFEGTTLADLTINGQTVIPAGSVMRGVVTDVDPAT